MARSTTFKTIALFWRYNRQHKLLFSAAAIGVVLAIICQDIIPPFVVSRAFARLNAANAQHHMLAMADVRPYLVTFTASMLLGLAFWRLQGFATWQYEIRAARTLAVDIFKHIEHQGQKFHADRFGGSLVSQANKFAGAYEKLNDELIWSILPAITTITFSSAVLLVVAPGFAVILLVVVALYVAIMWQRIKRQFPYNRREAEAESRQTAALADAITNISTIRSFTHENYELQRFSKAADKSYRAYQDLSVVQFKNDSISHTITNSLRITSLIFGVFAIVNWHADISLLYLTISYASATVDLLWRFGRIMRNVNRSLGDAAEMTEILQLTPEISDPVSAKPVHIHSGRVSFDGVTFTHDADEHDQSVLFNQLSLTIKPGEKVGLIGRSGSGKTTLTRLLLRFMDIQAGEIAIDGHNITSLTQHDLRASITYVPQEPMLFHRTIAENIAYGKLEASDKEIQAVAKLANAAEFIQQLPKGFDTLVGERGVKLSGGQRQRVVIARAMLKNAPILVLDEATSALDSESEVLIQDALWKLMEGRTAIVIAHRLSTIQKMDRIVVLDKGRIVEQGSHKELIRQDGTYAKLWAHQSGGFIED